jgi:molybdopterin guanine dinucleotide-containing S/N-oxide reductase-like protein
MAGHYGEYKVHTKDGVVTRLSFPEAPHKPTVKTPGMRNRTYAPDRIKYPMKRKGYEPGGGGDKSARGNDEFVRISWEEAFDLVAEEFKRVKTEYGNEAIQARSGWSCGGNFHDAGGPLNRFVNLNGGGVGDWDNYSLAAEMHALPYSMGTVYGPRSNHKDVVENSDICLWWSADPTVTGNQGSGGSIRNEKNKFLIESRDAGVDHIFVNPKYGESIKLTDGEHISIIPGTDSAMMAAMAYVMLEEDLHDQEFIDEYVVGFEPFEQYVMGEEDGQPKTPEWAEEITDVPADTIRSLTRRITNNQTHFAPGWAFQRSKYGEQPVRMLVTIAAMVGQIGEPGGSLSYWFHYTDTGTPSPKGSGPGSLPVPSNQVDIGYPTAKIADALLHSGEEYDFDGEVLEYPDIQFLHVAGEELFTAQGDTNKLVEAFRQPETVVVNEPWWTPTAEHADIVLPVAWQLERNDIASGGGNTVTAMEKAIEPLYESKTDWDICRGLSKRMGNEALYTEGKSVMDWLEVLFNSSDVPLSFDEFWEQGRYEFETTNEPRTAWSSFREDPEANPLGTPSGKIEVYSEQIDEYDYDDCPPVPKFMEPEEYLGSPKAEEYPLHVQNPHPKYRLHSQPDNVAMLRKWSKVNGKEPVWIHPDTAAERGIEDGDVVRVYNDRGATLGGAKVTKRVRPDCIAMRYGAWTNQEDSGNRDSPCKEGSVDMVTPDYHSSSLAQGFAAKSTLGEVEKYGGD